MTGLKVQPKYFMSKVLKILPLSQLCLYTHQNFKLLDLDIFKRFKALKTRKLFTRFEVSLYEFEFIYGL